MYGEDRTAVPSQHPNPELSLPVRVLIMGRRLKSSEMACGCDMCRDGWQSISSNALLELFRIPHTETPLVSHTKSPAHIRHKLLVGKHVVQQVLIGLLPSSFRAARGARPHAPIDLPSGFLPDKLLADEQAHMHFARCQL